MATARLWLALHMRAARERPDAAAAHGERLRAAVTATGRHWHVRGSDGDETDWDAALEADPDDGAEIVRLPPGTPLYHATHGGISAADILRRDNFFGDWGAAAMYFAPDYARFHPDGAAMYRFVVREDRPLRLLAIDEPAPPQRPPRRTNGRSGARAALATVIRCAGMDALQASFPVAPDGRMYRRWDFENDRRLMRRLRRALPGLDGVAVRTELPLVDGSGTSPPELWLADPDEGLRFDAEALLPDFGVLFG